MEYKITETCVTCGACLLECPEEAIFEGDETYQIDQDKCSQCGNCVEACPVDAVIEEN